MAVSRTLEGLIVEEPELRGGQPIIAGTGVTVRTVVGHFKLELTPEKIDDEMGIALAGIYTALTCYHLKREQIDADILANSEEAVMKSFRGD